MEPDRKYLSGDDPRAAELMANMPEGTKAFEQDGYVYAVAPGRAAVVLRNDDISEGEG